MKKLLFGTSGIVALFCAAPFLNAENFTASQSGNWSDPLTWGQTVSIPGTEDTVYFNDAVKVTLSESLTFKNIGWKNNLGGANAIFEITGDSTVVNITDNTDLYYNMRLNWNITQGATVNSAAIAWGNGGYANMSIIDSTFNISNFSQLRGSRISDGSVMLIKGTMSNVGGTYSSTSNMTINGNTTLDPNEAWDGATSGKMTFEIDGGMLNVAGASLNLSPAAEKTEARVVLKNGGIANIGNNLTLAAGTNGISSIASISLADTSIIRVTNSFSVTGSQNASISKANLQGTSSINVGDTTTVAANAESSKALITLSDDATIFTGNFIVGGSGVNGTSEVTLSDSSRITASNDLLLQATTDSHAIINVGTGTTFSSTRYVTLKYSGTSTLNVNGGTVTGNQVYMEASNGGSALLRISSGGNVTINSSFTIRSRETATNEIMIFGAGSSLVANGGDTMIGDSTTKVENSTARLTFGGFDENGGFVAAQAGALKDSWQFKVNKSGELNFLLGASNAQATAPSSSDLAILQSQFFKTVMGDFYVDLRNVDSAALGEGYFYFCLISSTQSISDGTDWNGDVIDWANTIKYIDGQNVKYDTYYVENNKLYIGVNVIPEPSAYAAIFGALALAFAAYRRRK